MNWLFEAKKRYSLSILNFAVTSNHIHLLVVVGIRGIRTAYARPVGEEVDEDVNGIRDVHVAVAVCIPAPKKSGAGQAYAHLGRVDDAEIVFKARTTFDPTPAAGRPSSRTSGLVRWPSGKIVLARLD